jgi:hypothetical protein
MIILRSLLSFLVVSGGIVEGSKVQKAGVCATYGEVSIRRRGEG